MKKYLILAASALLLAACSEKPGYEINGTVANTDLNGKYVYLYEYGVQDAAPMDSALVQNGTFTFKGTQEDVYKRQNKRLLIFQVTYGITKKYPDSSLFILS